MVGEEWDNQFPDLSFHQHEADYLHHWQKCIEIH